MYGDAALASADLGVGEGVGGLGEEAGAAGAGEGADAAADGDVVHHPGLPSRGGRRRREGALGAGQAHRRLTSPIPTTSRLPNKKVPIPRRRKPILVVASGHGLARVGLRRRLESAVLGRCGGRRVEGGVEVHNVRAVHELDLRLDAGLLDFPIPSGFLGRASFVGFQELDLVGLPRRRSWCWCWCGGSRVEIPGSCGRQRKQGWRRRGLGLDGLFRAEEVLDAVRVGRCSFPANECVRVYRILEGLHWGKGGPLLRAGVSLEEAVGEGGCEGGGLEVAAAAVPGGPPHVELEEVVAEGEAAGGGCRAPRALRPSHFPTTRQLNEVPLRLCCWDHTRLCVRKEGPWFAPCGDGFKTMAGRKLRKESKFETEFKSPMIAHIH